MQKENNRLPPPWGNDMEEALAQAEAMQKKQYPYPVVAGYRGVDLLGWG
jgi:hypothetical protein